MADRLVIECENCTCYHGHEAKFHILPGRWDSFVITVAALLSNKYISNEGKHIRMKLQTTMNKVLVIEWKDVTIRF